MAAFASAVLAPAGVRCLFGPPITGLPVIEAPVAIAGVLARAHQVVRNSSAGWVSSGQIEVPGMSSGEPVTLTVDGQADTADLIEAIRGGSRAGGVRIQIGFDPEAPWEAASPALPEPWAADLGDVVERIAAAGRIVVLAGPGVVRDGHVPGLHSLAATLGVGVLNTWGAKGIFHWRSLHHLATIGLQELDFSLAGLDEADLVVATGVDGREAPEPAWAHRPHVVVDPAALAPLAEKVPARPLTAWTPPIRTRLAEATQAGWQTTSTPIPPSLATLHYCRRLAPGGLIAADGGLPGFWVARTFATTELGAVAVPPFTDPGWAAACVTVARLADPFRPALAVVEGSVDETSRQVLEFGRSRQVTVGIEIWGDDGDRLSAGAHDARLATLTDPVGPGAAASLATDPAQVDAFIEAAGAVRSWSPPAPSV